MKAKPRTSQVEYRVVVTRQDESRAVAKARDHQLSLNIKKGDGQAGFNAAETLLAALGACMLTNVNSLSEKMRLRVNSASVEFAAARRDEPPGLTRIDYRLIIDSPEPEERLTDLIDLSVKWGTVLNTLTAGLRPEGATVIRDRPREGPQTAE